MGHILIVDDEEAIRFTLSCLLQRNGYAVKTAATSTEAIGLILSQPFDLLLLDLILPGMNGIALAKYARKLQPTVAILVLTGSQELGDDLDYGVRDGFDWMYKTASPQAVLDRVAALTNR